MVRYVIETSNGEAISLIAGYDSRSLAESDVKLCSKYLNDQCRMREILSSEVTPQFIERIQENNDKYATMRSLEKKIGFLEN